MKKRLILSIGEDLDREYIIEESNYDWWNLSCDGSHIAKLVSEEECRRVIWSYWTNQGIYLDVITEDNFTIISE